MFTLLKYNTKIILSYNAIAACIYVLLTPLFFNLYNMRFIDLAKMGELYLSITGVLLFNRLSRIEEYYNTWELVYCRPTSFILIHLGRILETILLNVLIISFPLIFAYINSKELKFGEGFWGLNVSSWFLGLLGMLIVEITRNYKAGYLVGIGYYFFETSIKDKFMEDVQVFGYIHENFKSKIYVFAICIIFIILQLVLIMNRLVRKGGNNGYCNRKLK